MGLDKRIDIMKSKKVIFHKPKINFRDIFWISVIILFALSLKFLGYFEYFFPYGFLSISFILLILYALIRKSYKEYIKKKAYGV